MSSKAPHYYGVVAEPAGERDSATPIDDRDDNFVFRVLTIALGLYLLIAVVLLRLAYRLSRQLAPSRWRAASSDRKARRLDSTWLE